MGRLRAALVFAAKVLTELALGRKMGNVPSKSCEKLRAGAENIGLFEFCFWMSPVFRPLAGLRAVPSTDKILPIARFPCEFLSKHDLWDPRFAVQVPTDSRIIQIACCLLIASIAQASNPVFPSVLSEFQTRLDCRARYGDTRCFNGARQKPIASCGAGGGRAGCLRPPGPITPLFSASVMS